MAQVASHVDIPLNDAQGLFATLHLRANAPPRNPVAILFGWTGSSARMLEKYAAGYRARGFHVMAVPSRFHFGLTFSVYSLDRLRKEMDVVVDALKEHLPGVLGPESGQPEQVVVQVFSNGGSHSLYHFLSNLDRRREAGEQVSLSKTVLLVMDSSPNLKGEVERAQFSLSAIRGFARFLMPNLGWKPTPTNETLVFMIALVTFPAMLLARPFLPFVAPSLAGHDFSTEVRAALTSPEFDRALRLFLYGPGDIMVPAEGIRIFRDDEMARLGKDRISFREFEGSAHVQHGMKWPKEYWEAVDGALNKAGIKAKL
ncbi:hypothetical protein DFJ74DRAFT_50727 [Hyaloraphidium curvatum]|nr:hypothetical protein DFJ74DRAFT_50727 [Hyaloraphidium curvatum]